MSKKRFSTVAEVMQLVEEYEARTKRLPGTLGYQSSEILRCLRQLIVLCNSVCIVFLQYDLVAYALQVVRKAAAADVVLYREGSGTDHLWEGRVIIYNNLTYLFAKAGDYQAALKFMFDAQSLLSAIKAQGSSVSSEVLVCSRLVAFSVLYRVQYYKDALKYVALAAQTVNHFVDGSVPTNLSKVTCLNLYGVVVICLASALVKQNRDKARALKLLDESLQTVRGHQLAVISLMERLKHELERMDDETANSDSLPTISRFSAYKSVVTSPEFEKVFFIVIFIPFISSNTPPIKASELELISSKTQSKQFSAVDLTRLLLNKRLPANSPRLPRDFSDNYINLIASVVETPRRKARSTQSRVVLKDKFKSLKAKRPHFKSATSPGSPFKRIPPRRPRKKIMNKSFASPRTHRIFNQDVEFVGYDHRNKTSSSMMVEFSPDTPRNVLVEVVPLRSAPPPRYRSLNSSRLRAV